MPILTRRHLLLAVAAHVALFVLLTVGVQCSPEPTQPEVIDAVIVPAPSVRKPSQPDRQRVIEEQKKQEQELLQKQQEEHKAQEQREQEQQRLREQGQREAEERRQSEEAERRQAELALKKAQEEEARKKAEEERRAEEEAREKAEEERRKAEEERKRAEEQARKAAEEKRRRQEEARRQQEEMARQMIAEEAARAEAEYIAGVQATWGQQLEAHIRSYWIRPPSLPPGLQCVVQISLLPNGEVVNVGVVRGSGVPAFDDSVLRAVRKASPVPLPQDPRAFQREIRATFTPENLE